MSKSMLSRWMPKSLHRASQRPRMAAMLNLQSLEARETPAAHTFMNAAGGAWSTAGNWLNNSPPIAGEADCTVTINGNVATTMDISGLNIDNLNLPSGGTINFTKSFLFDGNADGDQLSAGGNATFTGSVLSVTGNSFFNVAAGKTVSIGNNISGSGGLVTTGAGNLELKGAGTWQGETNLFSGNLILNSNTTDGALPNTALIIGNSIGTPATAIVTLAANFEIPDTLPVTIRADGAMNFAGFTEDFGPLELAGGIILQNGGQFNVKGDIHVSNNSSILIGTANSKFNLGDVSRSIDVNANCTLTINSQIVGTGGVIKEGKGTLVYGFDSGNAAVANTYTGTTNVKAGTLLLAGGLGNGGFGGDLIVGNGTAADGTATVQITSAVGQIPNDKTTLVAIDGTLDFNGKSEVIGDLILAGGTVKTGTGTVTLGGDLTAAAVSATSKITGKLDLGGADQLITVQDGSAATDLQISATIIGAGGLIKEGAGLLLLDSSDGNTFAGKTWVKDGTLTLATSTSGDKGLSANVVVGDSVGTADSAVLNLTSDFEVPDAGTITVNGDGQVNVLPGGIEDITNLVLNGGQLSIAAGATFRMRENGVVTTTGSGSSIDGAGNFQLQAVKTTFNVADGPDVRDLLLSAVITGSADFVLDASGTLAIVGANDGTPNIYVGTTIIKNGTLLLDDDMSNVAVSKSIVIGDGIGAPGTARLVNDQPSEIPNDANVTINSDGVLDPGSVNEVIGSLTLVGGQVINSTGFSLTGNLTVNASSNTAKIVNGVTFNSAAPMLTVADGGATTDLQIDGSLSSLTALTRNGAGTLVANGAGVVTGGLTLASGDTFINGITSTAVTLSGGLLGGTGNIGKLTQTGGTLAPGSSGPGTFTTANADLNGILFVQLNGTAAGQFDQLKVNGTVDLTGATLSRTLGFASALGNSFRIVDNDGADAVVGTFAGLPQNAVFALGGRNLQISYTGGDGNDVTLTDVNLPPSSNASLIGYREFAVGSDVGAGAATLYNADGSVRYSISPYEASFTGGVRTAAADFTGDGVADLVVASGPGRPGNVRVHDGVSQNVLFDFSPFGDAFTRGIVVTAGDITADGKAELVLTAERGGGARVRVFTPTVNGFQQMTDFFGLIGGDNKADTNFRGGARAAVGDVDGDGFGDLIFAAGAGGGPRVAIFDGQNLGPNGGPKLRGDFFAFEPTLRDGTYVAAGDFNGDGLADLVAGAGPGGGPRVSVFNGANLVNNQEVKLKDFFAGNIANRGGVRVTVKNLDNDSKGDLVVGAGPGGGSRTTSYNGVALLPAVIPSPNLDFDAFAGFNGGVYVG